MTSQGSPYVRFRRALATGNLSLVRAAAAELPRVDLDDAIAVLVLMAQRADPSYDRGATRWLARLALERPAVGLEDLSVGLDALEGLAQEPGQARPLLRSLCERHGLERAARMLT